MSWRSEPGHVEKCLDEVWVGVKGQSNLEIARSPEIVLGLASINSVAEVEH